MQLIFLNSLERKTGEDRAAGAQISITERQGTWSVQWNEGGPDGKPLQDSWYEGPLWEGHDGRLPGRLAEEAVGRLSSAH